MNPRTIEVRLDLTDGNDPNLRVKKAAVYEPLIADFLNAKGLADPAMASWAAPLVAEWDMAGLDSPAMGRRLRVQGEPLTPAEKKAMGFPVRLKIGRQFVEALTEKGREDVDRTAYAIAHHPVRCWSRAWMRLLIERDRSAARMLIRNDAATCASGRLYFQKILPLRDLPSFPLPDCDQLVCRCGFDRLPREQEEPTAPAPAPIQAYRVPPPRPHAPETEAEHFRRMDEAEATRRGRRKDWMIGAALIALLAALGYVFR